MGCSCFFRAVIWLGSACRWFGKRKRCGIRRFGRRRRGGGWGSGCRGLGSIAAGDGLWRDSGLDWLCFGDWFRGRARILFVGRASEDSYPVAVTFSRVHACIFIFQVLQLQLV